MNFISNNAKIIKISARGQVTIPANILKLSGLTKGMSIKIELVGDKIQIYKQTIKKPKLRITKLEPSEIVYISRDHNDIYDL